jgi:hypothetical protein
MPLKEREWNEAFYRVDFGGIECFIGNDSADM